MFARSNESKCRVIFDFAKFKFERFDRDWIIKSKSLSVRTFQTSHAND